MADFSFNQLSTFPQELFSCATLTDLAISGNGLAELPPAVKNLKNLRFFVGDSNDIQSLPADITQLPALQKLSLANNRLSALPADLGNSGKLVMLDASVNMLRNVPASIAVLPSLGALFLRHNRLDSLPDRMVNLTGFHPETGAARYATLDLSYNRLCALKGALKAWADRFDPGWESKQDCSGAR
jgi:Leucine-rich repeat (LRR) protein